MDEQPAVKFFASTELQEESAKRSVGRPSKLTKEVLELVPRLFMVNQALTDVGLAKILDVSVSTISQWKLENPEFLEAVNNGKERADAKVVSRFYERAIGVTVTEEQLDKEGNVRQLKRELPPDTAAGFIWLKNRAGWRDRTETVNVNVELNVVEYAREYAKRVNPEAAKRFLEDHGYSGELIELQPEEP